MEILRKLRNNILLEIEGIKYLDEEEVEVVFKTMEVLADKITELELESTITRNNVVVGYSKWSITNSNNIDRIVCYGNCASDEFVIFSRGTDESLTCVEVVTDERARENDMDFLEDDQIKGYKLHGKYSYYKKLKGTEYSYREM